MPADYQVPPRGKQLPPRPPQTDLNDDIQGGADILTRGLKRLFEGVITAENLEEDVVRVAFSMNFKMLYSGGVVVCDPARLEQCEQIKLKSDESNNTPKHARVGEFFIPINYHDNKYRTSERTKSLAVSSRDPADAILESFRKLENRDKILVDSMGTKYKLLSLSVDGYITTYQRYVYTSNKHLYRIGTRENNMREKRNGYYIPYPVTEHIPMSAIKRFNRFLWAWVVWFAVINLIISNFLHLELSYIF